MTDDTWHYLPVREPPDDVWFDWDEYIATHTDADGFAITWPGDDDWPDDTEHDPDEWAELNEQLREWHSSQGFPDR